jgi:hypothetical protein
MPATRYLATAAAVTLGSFVLVWIWVAAMPLAYLDPEYPAWLAKRQMLRHCDIGDVLLLGDSRAAVDVRPGLLPLKLANLAVGGGEAIEAYVALTRALNCPIPPRRVVISFDAIHFTKPDLFWERSVRFGFLNARELADVRAAAARIGDRSFADPKLPDGLPATIRGWLYAARFPPVYFSSLAKGGVFLRLWRNEAALRAALAAQGQYYFGRAAGSSVIAAEGHMTRFVPLALLDDYFNRMLALLAARRIPVDFIAMPMNQATGRSVPPDVRAGFAAYLARYAARYPNFHVLGSVMPAWPDRYFGDGFSHLNPEGAALLSAWFGACLQARMDQGTGGADRAPALLPVIARPPGRSTLPGGLLRPGGLAMTAVQHQGCVTGRFHSGTLPTSPRRGSDPCGC